MSLLVRKKVKLDVCELARKKVKLDVCELARKKVKLDVCELARKKVKLDVCELARKKVPYKQIMKKYGIGKSIFIDIVKSETDLKSFKMSKNKLCILKAAKTTKSMRGGMFDDLDRALYIWFRQQREKGIPILIEKAYEFHNLL